MRSCSFVLAFFLILMLSCNTPIYANLSESHTPTENVSTIWTTKLTLAIQPVLVRETNVARFTFGYDCANNCNSKTYIFSITTSPATNITQDRVVWSANRDHPVRVNATLNFTADGELVLKDEYGSIVWTTNTAGKSVVGMNLTDNGNLVLFNDQDLVVWQSFDHPTDCLLPGQSLLEGKKMKASVSLTNSSEGMYYLQVTDEGLYAYVESNPPQAYLRVPFNMYFNGTNKGSRRVTLLNGSLSFFMDSSNRNDPVGVIDLPLASPQYMKLMPEGHLQVVQWHFGNWIVVSDFTIKGTQADCNYPLSCGTNAICWTNGQCGCLKLDYFRPVNDRQPSMGCYEITPFSCNSTQDQDFLTLEKVSYFTLVPDMIGVTRDTCKHACLNNCSCKAAFFQYDSDASSGECFLTSQLFTIQADDSLYNNLAFIKVRNVTSPHLPFQVPTVVGAMNRASNQVAKVVGSTIGSFVLMVIVAIGFITYVVHKQKKDAETEEEYLNGVPGMPTRFSYEELITATENFSKKLGEGGFGSVFEGSLKDGSKIAVKCLEGHSHVNKSFLAEVQSIGSIHHLNLVRLRGFCTWKSRRFLVYDFMSNGSLDQWIYHRNREHTLEWECRKKIILDISKGLAYLHEECRQKIIHLDIKPQNILLDDDFNAKVSDFGLSKLIDRNQSQVITTMRGTPGYLAPEWLSSVITEKVDVYSFGIVLLEILSGRKNFDRSYLEESWHLLRVFQNCWEQEKLFDMVDMNSKDMQMNGTEVVEMMKMASWCLQTDYTRRPSMSSVVKVLEGGMKVDSNLDYNFTDPRLQKNNSQEKDLTPLLASVLSGPR